MTAARLWLSALFVLSCGGKSAERLPPRDAGDDSPSGERLRAVTIESADGIGVFRYFEDTALDLNCNFAPIERGTWRCLPAGPAADRVMDLVYTDAACTEPRAALYRSRFEGQEGCTPPRHVVAGGDCGTTPEVFELGSQVPADTRYRLIDGVCSISEGGTDYLTDLYALTPIPLERFERASLKVGDETGGVAPLDVVSDEGAGIRIGFRDATEGFECHLVGSDDDSRCLPKEMGLMGYVYADSECTEPAAMLTYCADERTEISFAQSLPGNAYYRGGPRLGLGYVGDVGNCMPSQINVAFAVGPEVPITLFAAGRRTVRVEGDLVAKLDTVGDASLPPPTLESTAHGGYECFVARGTDGELRCLPPPERYVSEFFADPECTQPVVYTQRDVLAVEVAGVCPPEVRVYARGDHHPAPVYAVVEGSCMFAHDRPPMDSGRTPYHVFPSEIPAAEFAPLFEVKR